MNSDLKARLWGAVLIIIGAAISWPTIFDRIRLAQEDTPEISVWSLASFLVGPLIVFGFVMLILGEKTEDMTRDAEKKRMKPLGNVIALICLLAGFAGMLGTTFVLQSFGYR